MSTVFTELSPDMVEQLQGKNLVLLHVLHPESGIVYTTALSWVFAVHSGTIRFAIDAKSDYVRLLQQDSRLSLSFMAAETVLSVQGEAVVRVPLTEELTLKMALIEVEVKEVRDIMFYGGKMTSGPIFVKTYKQELINKLDNEISKALLGLPNRFV